MLDAVVTHVGNIVEFVVVSSVIAVFVALVAVVDDVAVVALPDNAPVKVVVDRLFVLGLKVIPAPRLNA